MDRKARRVFRPAGGERGGSAAPAAGSFAAMQRNQKSPGADTMRLRRIRLVSYAVRPPDPRYGERHPMVCAVGPARKTGVVCAISSGAPCPCCHQNLEEFCFLTSAPVLQQLWRRAVVRAATKIPPGQAPRWVEEDSDCIERGVSLIGACTVLLRQRRTQGTSCADEPFLRGPGGRLYVTQALAPSHILSNPGGALAALPTRAK